MPEPVSPARTESIALDDGAMDLHLWLPEGDAGPGILLLQEIFGVEDWLRSVATRLAGLGYVVGAPDLFWRLQPNFRASHDEAGLQQSFDLVGRLDVPGAVADATAALERLTGLPEVQGGTATFGYCLGGTLSWLVAAAAEPTCAVSYYGSGVPDLLDRVDDLHCPVLVQFGGADAYIPRERVAQVEAALADHDRFEVHVHEDAGHAFENDRAPGFHQPEAAARSWAVTTDFLQRRLPA